MLVSQLDHSLAVRQFWFSQREFAWNMYILWGWHGAFIKYYWMTHRIWVTMETVIWGWGNGSLQKAVLPKWVHKRESHWMVPQWVGIIFNSSKWFKIHLEEWKSKIRSKAYVKGDSWGWSGLVYSVCYSLKHCTTSMWYWCKY